MYSVPPIRWLPSSRRQTKSSVQTGSTTSDESAALDSSSALPILLLVALRRTGFDRRAYHLQSLTALAAVGAGRLADPGANVNSAFVDPLLKRSFEPAALHLAVIVGGLVVVVYPLTALVLSRVYPRPR